jgi:hypothetical protein
MSREAEIRRAEHARALLDDDVLKAAFAEIEAEYLANWAASPVRDAAGREAIWMMVRTLRKVRGHLDAFVDGGKAALISVQAQDRARELTEAKGGTDYE